MSLLIQELPRFRGESPGRFKTVQVRCAKCGSGLIFTVAATSRRQRKLLGALDAAHEPECSGSLAWVG